MENYSLASYPDSGDSSPRSREIDFENTPPWDDQLSSSHPQNYKVKFMCSYGGKIQPRPHDNQLSYIAGETKILSVDRNIKFNSIVSKLSALCADDQISFKYQLPGEDLDALISVTNDDDLEHMMHEYDRLYRASPKPARMRLFLFPEINQPASFGSDRERFVDALNSAPTEPPKAPPPNNVDFLFGLDKGRGGGVVSPPPPTAIKQQDNSVPELAAVGPPPDFSTRLGDRGFGSDQVMNPVEMQRQLQELQRLQIGEQQEQNMYRRKSDENLVGVGPYSGDYYVPKAPERANPSAGQAPAGYWPEKQVSGGGFAVSAPEQQMYMIPAQGAIYQHPQMVRQPPPPVTGPTGQGYYTMQRVGPDVYRDQQVYNVVSPPQQPILAARPPQPPKMAAAYTEGYGMVRPSGGSGVGVADTSAYMTAYDNATGRQVFYTTATGGPPPSSPYQGVGAVVGADMRQAGAMGHEGKVVNKVSQ